jgi:hypothetical protein
MQFTEKRLRVKWYGGFRVAWRITPRLGQLVSRTVQNRYNAGVAMRF